MVITYSWAVHHMHSVLSLYACSNQCCICSDANLGIAKLSGDREFFDGLARLILLYTHNLPLAGGIGPPPKALIPPSNT
jgi:hypothetical protein